SCRSAHIETILARDIDLPVFKCAFKFKSAAAYILEVFAEQPDCRIPHHLCASLVEFLIVDQHLSRENKSLGTCSGGDESAIHQESVQSDLQGWLRARFCV